MEPIENLPARVSMLSFMKRGGVEMNAVQTFKLTKEFDGLVAVNGVDLEVKKGELFSLLGPNGAGKTTTIRMLCCLLKPTRGTASILGYDVVKMPFAVKKLIGVSPQDTILSERLNCWENLALIGQVYGLGSDEVKRRSQQLLETMGLMERSKDQVRKFSGGMKRRLSIAMALVSDPQVLFLDEPTLGLDPQARRTIWEYIAGLKGKKTVLLTTHYMEEADTLSDRIGIIDEGKVVALGTAQELKTNLIEMRSMVVSTGNLTAEVLEHLHSKYSKVTTTKGKLKISHKDLHFKEIVDYLHSRGVTVYSATIEQPTLEDVFIHITGKKLRD
ncbi:MAG: ATP-binding cassette domain-containing protein [Dehalococcoidia bacterium]|nr:ATP-binding cassette domain-containing protein [Dehalococcoidia bacterium]